MLSLLFVTTAQAATIAELLAQTPSLSQVSQATSGFSWTGRTTLLAPTNSAISSTSGPLFNEVGYASTNEAVNHLSPEGYQLLTDGDFTLVFDNYTPNTANPEIHVRTAQGDMIVEQILEADDGYIYLLPAAIQEAPAASEALSYAGIGCGTFGEWVAEADFADQLNAMNGFTVFCPVDAALATQTLTPVQRKNLVYKHIAPRTIFSTRMDAGGLPTLLGEEVQIEFVATGAEIGGQSITVADHIVRGGVIQPVDGVFAGAIPTTEVEPVLTGGIAVTSSTTTATATTTSTTTKTSSTTTAPAATSSESSGSLKAVGSGFLFALSIVL